MELRDIYAITDADMTKYDSQFNFATDHVPSAGRGLLYYVYITSNAVTLHGYLRTDIYALYLKVITLYLIFGRFDKIRGTFLIMAWIVVQGADAIFMSLGFNTSGNSRFYR